MVQQAERVKSDDDASAPPPGDDTSTSQSPPPCDDTGDPTEPLNGGHRNEVTLVGRLASDVRERSMPSGALLLSFRLVVRRDSIAHGPNIDALDCIVWRAPVQRAIRRWAAGDLVEVRGAIRRRFWRGVSGSASRCEIEVSVVRRLARAAAGVSGGRRASRAASRTQDTAVDQRAGPPGSAASSA
jgi:single-strand DNA-binding protein